ncbi:Putrescine--pyruvate aminotransferase [Rhodovastum atsumiense]|uniref:Aspartate aminotransferase family protein n=1 Tax=Rhodovastum atsumiense TaxID=504468 RepID=A0A5M6J122_9PROT|nr:aspartate aminotransferase family protein [Rhodovastum atsumiense]KAA5614283.1 aspartate aminotransferase family protein [Rhodovastum atsumiense]CAH2604739.1 Putrescine--pyruvate aminotransferase [Rhodovastum atsumiense]
MNPPTPSAIRPNSNAARDIAAALHPYTDLVAHQQIGPVVITRGEGVRVWDDAGKSYIEAMAGLWCASLGFSNQRLVEAAVAQMRRLPFYHSFSAKSHEPLIELAEMLLARAPVPMSKVFFANSGSEANDSVVKMVWYFNNALGRPQKKKLIGRVKGYHGITTASASLTGIPTNHRSFDVPLAGFIHTLCPHHYRFGEAGESEEAFATRCAEELEKLILAEGPETVAAMWAEPIMGAGGVIVPPATYFEKIQPVLRKYDVLLVADEVICGFWRTGNYWGSQTYGIQPDILTCAKALSASYLPISAVLVNDRVFQGLAQESHRIGTFGHGFTYSGHPVPAAVAVETLKLYDELGIGEHVRRVGPYMQDGLRRRFADHELVGEVRGTGLIGAIELAEDKATHKPFDPARKIGPRLAKLSEANGVISRAMVDVLAFSPPLIITEAEIDEMLDNFGRALDQLAAELKQEKAA